MKQTERMTPQLKVGCFCLVCAIIKVLKAPYTLFSLHGAQIFNNRLSMRAASNKNCTPLHIKLNTFYWISEKASECERKKGLSNCIKGGKTKLPVALLHGSYAKHFRASFFDWKRFSPCNREARVDRKHLFLFILARGHATQEKKSRKKSEKPQSEQSKGVKCLQWWQHFYHEFQPFRQLNLLVTKKRGSSGDGARKIDEEN